MSLVMEVKDREDDGAWNHLLLSRQAVIECNDGRISGEIYISWSQQAKELPFKEGERFMARVTAACEAGSGIDEKASDEFNRWISYTVWTCTASKVEVLDESH